MSPLLLATVIFPPVPLPHDLEEILPVLMLAAAVRVISPPSPDQELESRRPAVVSISPLLLVRVIFPPVSALHDPEER
jgi:hypothetical protein